MDPCLVADGMVRSVGPEQAEAVEAILPPMCAAVEVGEYQGRKELRLPGTRAGRGCSVDYAKLVLRGLGDMPLIRACGPVSGLLIDSTFGLGNDSWFLAAVGWQVCGIERCGAVAEVAADALHRARGIPKLARVAGRIDLRCGDSIQLLRSRPEPTTVLVDPMYPRKKGSALGPLAIRLVREAVGDDDDAAALFAAAADTGARRVVVKRPHGAAPLGGEPDLVFEGKLARFDVYLKAGALRKR